MPKEITLPGNEWAIIHNPDEVPERLRRQYLLSQAEILDGADVTMNSRGKPSKMTMNSKVIKAVADSGDVLILAFTKKWSFESPITVEAVQDLPSGVYQALKEACEKAKDGLFVVADVDEAKDPASPIVPLVE